MASHANRTRLEAQEAYEIAIRRQFSNYPCGVALYVGRFADTRFRELFKRRRVLLRPEFWPHLIRALKLSKRWIRDPMDWSARGRSPNAILWSLVRHLHCRYAVAPFWLGEWLRSDEEVSYPRLRAFSEIGQGLGYYEASRSGKLGVALSRRECHHLSIVHGARDFGTAVRVAQVAARGGPRWLGPALAKTEWGSFERPSLEERRSAAIGWMARQPDLTPVVLRRICRFLDRRAPSLSGRTVGSLVRMAAVIHRPAPPRQRASLDDAITPATPPVRWQSCGLGPLVACKGARDWTMKELCSEAELEREARFLNHCVKQYVDQARCGACSIWSLRARGASVLTLEVRDRAIVQIGGYENRDPEAGELRIVRRWADRNGLEHNYG